MLHCNITVIYEAVERLADLEEAQAVRGRRLEPAGGHLTNRQTYNSFGCVNHNIV